MGEALGPVGTDSLGERQTKRLPDQGEALGPVGTDSSGESRQTNCSFCQHPINQR
mgnify:CR=1 FL=1